MDRRNKRLTLHAGRILQTARVWTPKLDVVDPVWLLGFLPTGGTRLRVGVVVGWSVRGLRGVLALEPLVAAQVLLVLISFWLRHELTTSRHSLWKKREEARVKVKRRQAKHICPSPSGKCGMRYTVLTPARGRVMASSPFHEPQAVIMPSGMAYHSNALIRRRVVRYWSCDTVPLLRVSSPNVQPAALRGSLA